MQVRFRPQNYAAALLCALAFAGAIALSHPVANLAMNDDWSYGITAQKLAQTGHLTYNGWATAMIGWQLYWGALLIRLFGFSQGVLRISTLLVAMTAIVLMQRIFVHCGLSRQSSVLATLTIAFSPAFFLYSFTYMTDITGLFAILVCLYGCVRAMKSPSTQATLQWLVFATVSNLLLGTSRQVYWLGALIMVPSAAWLLRRRPGVLLTTALLWLVSCAFVLSCMHWFRVQPYSIAEPLLPSKHDAETIHLMVVDAVRSVLTIVAFTLPAIFATIPLRNRKEKALTAALSLAFLALVAFLFHLGRMDEWMFPFTANTVGLPGLGDFEELLGTRPPIFSPLARGVVTAAAIAGVVSLIVSVCSGLATRKPTSEKTTAESLSWREVLTLLLPFMLAYALLFITRSVRWDRYLLPLCFFAVLCVLRLSQQRMRRWSLALSAVALVAMACLDVAGMHDEFSFYRARVAATDSLQAAGVQRVHILGGFEYDATTQIQTTGYFEDVRLHIADRAYRKPALRPVPSECRAWYEPHTPALIPQYALAFSLSPCLAPSGLPAVPFHTWLPFRNSTILIGRIP
jgi:hypothetical protein